MDICQASCSLTILCPEKYIDGIPMLDGGVCDSIPVCRAREDGFLNNVVILTKPKEYRKPNKKFYLPKFLLHKYPKLRHQLVMRYIGYNEILDYIDELENKGYVYVIRHKGDMRVTRTTTNYHLLKELYDECRMEGEKLIRDMELISQISFAAIFRYFHEVSNMSTGAYLSLLQFLHEMPYMSFSHCHLVAKFRDRNDI